jgi:hypothetical protein
MATGIKSALLSWRLIALSLFLLGLALIPREAVAQVAGGGFTKAGIVGQYYSDANFSTQAFTRNDVRLDFGTSNVTPPGGSPSAGYSAVGATNWSATWTGSFIPRFNETYTFRYFTSGTLSVSINGATAFINQASATSAPVSVTYSTAFTAGTTYNITVKYSTGTGPWGMFLHWSSPSFPEEAIEPLSTAMLTAETYNACIYSDQVMTSSPPWVPLSGEANLINGNVPLDLNGWPQQDGSIYLWRGLAHKTGTFEIQFKGEADVSFFAGTSGTFSVGTTSLGSTLPAGVAYDVASGEGFNGTTTTARVTISGDFTNFGFTFKHTKRSSGDPDVTDSGNSWGTGITNFRLMKPLSTGSTAGSYGFNTLFTTGFKTACQNFTAIRWLTANINEEVEFNDPNAKTPISATQDGEDGVFGNSHWESEIELSNETGKDLYITIPVKASANNLASIVNLIHYGADINFIPYTSATASPVYPPLNPNLAVYVEWSNEVWNYAGGFSAFHDLQKMCIADAAGTGSSADWSVINYDGAGTTAPANLWGRLEGLRVVQASNAFRASYGDAAMGTHVRVLLEDLYGNSLGIPQFIDHYFNKTDPNSTYKEPAHPLNYYVYGGGGATYYGAHDSSGSQTAAVVANPGFETDTLASGTSSTTISGWTTTGTSGIYATATKSSALASTPSPTGTNSTTAASYGYKFTVGANDIGVYSLGRWKFSGNTAAHTIRLIDASGTQLASVSISTNSSSQPANAFVYANIYPSAVRLTAGSTYYVLSDETVGGDAFVGTPMALQSTSDLSIVAPAHGTSGKPWTLTDGTVGSTGYGPVDLLYTTRLSVQGFPRNPHSGNNAAYIIGTGSIQQTVNVTTAGIYAMSMDMAWGLHTYSSSTNQANPLRFFIDSTEVTPNPNYDLYNIFGAPYVAGGFAVVPTFFNYRTTIATPLTAGSHTILIEGTATGPLSRYAYLDNITLNSVEAIIDAGIPGGSGYAATLNKEANWPKAYGLRRVAYEGGWGVASQAVTGGGDGSSLLDNYVRWGTSAAHDISVSILNTYAQSGGDLDGFGTYETWPGTSTENAANGPTTYTVMQGIADAGNALRAEPINGALIPAILKPSSISYGDQNTAGVIKAKSVAGFVSWNIIASTSDTYTFNVSSTGGPFIMLLDGGTTVAQNGSLSLTRGLHAVKVQAIPPFTTAVTVSSVAVTQAGPSGSPTISGITSDSGTATVTWSTVPGAAGYIVSWGTASGLYSTQADAGTAASYTLTSLKNNTAYYVMVTAYDSSARRSLPSMEKSFVSLTDGQPGTLASWSFTGNTGQETTVPATSATTRLTIGELSRGPGYKAGAVSLIASKFGTKAVANTYATTLADAIAQNQYDQFTISGNSKTKFSLSSFAFKPYFQGYNSNCMVGVTYSTDGTNFTPATVSGTGNESTYTADLTGATNLQGVSGPTTIRVYLFGSPAYSTTALDNLSVTGVLTAIFPPDNHHEVEK